MSILKNLIKLLLVSCPFFATAQSTYLNQGSKDIHFVERLEIKQQRNNDLNFSGIRPFNRKVIVTQAQFIEAWIRVM